MPGLPTSALSSFSSNLSAVPVPALAPLPTCVDDEHPLRYGTIESGALLDRVLYDIGLIGPE